MSRTYRNNAPEWVRRKITYLGYNGVVTEISEILPRSRDGKALSSRRYNCSWFRRLTLTKWKSRCKQELLRDDPELPINPKRYGFYSYLK